MWLCQYCILNGISTCVCAPPYSLFHHPPWLSLHSTQTMSLFYNVCWDRFSNNDEDPLHTASSMDKRWGRRTMVMHGDNQQTCSGFLKKGMFSWIWGGLLLYNIANLYRDVMLLRRTRGSAHPSSSQRDTRSTSLQRRYLEKWRVEWGLFSFLPHMRAGLS